METDDKIEFDPLVTIIPRDKYTKEDLPDTLAYPFWYEPHPIAKYACNQLRESIRQLSLDHWTQHNFGIHSQKITTQESQSTKTKEKQVDVGKMFGVLVVQLNDTEATLGYLKAFSGTILGVTDPEMYGFVPALYNRQQDYSSQEFSYQREEEKLNAMNKEVEDLESNPKRKQLIEMLNEVEERTSKTLAKARAKQKEEKKRRKNQREEMKSKLSKDEYAAFEQELIQQSAAYQRHVKQVKIDCDQEVEAARNALAIQFENRLQDLKQQRKVKSASVQKTLFEQYQFLNIRGETKSLLPIFANTALKHPPSGAGDCAAPKLFQYAFQKGYKPIALAEFWWGTSPLQEIRKHNFYYPACRGKCEPILSHMLKGLPVQDNPLDQVGIMETSHDAHTSGGTLDLTIIFEDAHIVVVDKPSEMLSVPGRTLSHSVYTIMQEKYPNATGPLLVHRLDMSTSGILLIAKDKDTHQKLQAQFVSRSVKKRYTALLEGNLGEGVKKKGKIDLPLALDYLNRPMQKVDFEGGKSAITHYEIVKNSNINDDPTRTRVHFYPVTGRTHQLRVHAAHALGLDTPIVGDDIYGQRDKRLCLHAGYLELTHPATNKKMVFTSETPF